MSSGSFLITPSKNIFSGILDDFEADRKDDQNFFVIVFGARSSLKFDLIFSFTRFLSFFLKEENFL